MLECWSDAEMTAALQTPFPPQGVSGQGQRPVSDRRHVLAAVCHDLARLLVEQAGRFQAVGHFSQGNDGLNANSQIDIGIRRFIRADRIEPVLLVHPDVLRLQTRQRLGIDVLGELLFGHKFDALAAAANIHRGFVTVERETGALRVDRAAGNRNHVAARKLGEQLDVVRNFTFGSGLFFVRIHVFGANAYNPLREFGFT